MSIGAAIRRAVAPAVALVLREFGSTVTIKRNARTRVGSTGGESAATGWAAVTSGTSISAKIDERQRGSTARSWGAELTVDAEALIAMGPDLTSLDDEANSLGLVVTAGDFVDRCYLIADRREDPIAGTVRLALTSTTEDI